MMIKDLLDCVSVYAEVEIKVWLGDKYISVYCGEAGEVPDDVLNADLELDTVAACGDKLVIVTV